jgi:peptidoglycan/LPS O-acetylase OafA/YrhL
MGDQTQGNDPALTPKAIFHLPWNPRLAHLRGAAALLVLLFHVFHSFFGHWQPQPGFSGLGWLVEGHTGVTLFFVLSGYLFMSIAQQQHGTLHYGAFLRNRVLRVAPLFLLFYLVAISIGRDAFRPMDILYVVFSNIGQAPTSNQFITGAAWTVGLEFTFYLVFPFIARFALQHGLGYLPRLVLLLLLLKWGAYTVSDRSTHMIYSTLLGRLDQFLVGMLAAQWVAAWQARQASRTTLSGAWLVAAGVALWAALEAQSLHASYFLSAPKQMAWVLWPTLEAALWAAVLVAYTHWRGGLGRWADAFLARAGEISYSIYLWHALVIHALLLAIGPLLAQWLQWAPWHVWAVLITLATLSGTWVLATLSYRVIERPFASLRRGYGREATGAH